tara:strand:- start:5910 stop:7154 length:1245 start_codon:yes stop_codon:yes gene_type:complete
MLTGIVLNRSLGPELKGEYASLRLLVSFFAPLLMLGYTGGVLYYAIRKKLDIEAFYFTGLITMFIAGLIATFVLYFAISLGLFGEILQNMDREILWIILILTPFIFLNAYLERVLYSFKLFRPSNKRNVIAALIILVGSSLLWYFEILSLFNAVLVLGLSLVSNFILNIRFISQLFSPTKKIDCKNIFFPWKYGIQSFIEQIISKSNDKFDLIILGFIISPASFGIYTAGVAVASLVSGIPSSYTNVFYTQIATRDLDSAILLFEKAIRITLYLTTAIGLVLVLLSKYLILFLYGNAFAGAAVVVLFYLPGLVFQVSARLSIKFYAAQGKPLKNSLVYMVALLISSPFYFVLIPPLGIKGAAISSSVGYFVAFVFSIYQLKRDYHFSLRNILVLQKVDFLEISTKLKSLFLQLK